MPEEDAWAAFDGFQETHGAGGSVAVEVAAKELQEALDGSHSDSGSGSDCDCECDDDELCQMWADVTAPELPSDVSNLSGQPELN